MTTPTIFEKGQTVRVLPERLKRMTAAEQRRLSDRHGVVQTAFLPQGRPSQSVSVQWLSRNNTKTFGLPESWAPAMLDLVVPDLQEQHP